MSDEKSRQSSGSGPGWPELPDPIQTQAEWVGGHALTGVWRDLLAPPVAGATGEARERLLRMRTNASWDPQPEPGSNADIGEAIFAKINLSLALAPLLAEAQLLSVQPLLAHLLPFPVPDEELVGWAQSYQPPAPTLFVDFEDEDGTPVLWDAETWPLPFHLRGALTWTNQAALSVIPFGSVSGRHLIGGTDYQPWARLVLLREQPPEEAWPQPGQGDVLLAPDGTAATWVKLDTESHCAHQASIATHLAFGALSMLSLLDRLEVPFGEPPLPRPARRRASRAGQRIGWVPLGLPELRTRKADDADDEIGDDRRLDAAEAMACPVGKTHTRLDQAHTLWHEALDAYQEPDLFATKLNALLTALRSVTFVLQKELAHTDGFQEWWDAWRARMSAIPLMRWSLEARNKIEKQGDLDTASVAAVRITGDFTDGQEILVDVDPDATPSEIARRVRVDGALPLRVRHEGVLVIERRWTLAELEGREILDALAECFGVLAQIVADAHARADVSFEECELSVEEPHHAAVLALQPSGRPPCMASSREVRTSRRSLSDGAPVGLEILSKPMPTAEQLAEAADRYGLDEADHVPPDDDIVEHTRRMHDVGRRMLVEDGHHRTIVWLVRGEQPVGMTTLNPEDQRDKFMMIEQLADDVTRLGADHVTFAAEMWEAPPVPEDDRRAARRPEERDDRTESFCTTLLRRDAPAITFRSPIIRDDDKLTLGEPQTIREHVPPFLQPIIDAWAAWPA
jgi:hypothetical protein